MRPSWRRWRSETVESEENKRFFYKQALWAESERQATR
jgi:hypothetical protein